MQGGLSVEVAISGDAQFTSKLEGIIPALADFKEALEETGKGLKSYFSNQVFDSQGGVYGTPWQSLSAGTVAFKAKHYYQYQAVPLIETGTMRNSFEYKASSRSLAVTNTAPYFKYHQSTAPRTIMPRRPMFAINSAVKRIIQESFEKAFIAKMAGL